MCYCGGDFCWALFWPIQAVSICGRGASLWCGNPLLSPNNFTLGHLTPFFARPSKDHHLRSRCLAYLFKSYLSSKVEVNIEHVNSFVLRPYIYDQFPQAPMAQWRRARRAHAREYVRALSNSLRFLLSRSALAQMQV